MSGLLAMTAGTVDAQCSYPALTSGVSVDYPPGAQVFPAFTQPSIYWSAVGLRPDSATDWDLSVHQGTAAFPACVGTQLANSVRGTGQVDFVIGDFNHTPLGTYPVRVYPFSGSGGVRVEWDDGPNQLVPNTAPVVRETGPDDILECWDLYAQSPSEYRITFETTGPAQLSLLFFKNPAAATYWVGRNSRTFEWNGSTAGTLLVTDADWWGLVVVNENGLTGSYSLRVETCQPPVALASGVPVAASGFNRHYSFNQTFAFFTAIGVRQQAPAENWDLRVYQGGSEYPPDCFQPMMAWSIEPSGVDYIVGDFNSGANPIGTSFARAYPAVYQSSSALVEWDGGTDYVYLDAAPIWDTTGPADVLRAWDIYMYAGQTYTFHLTQDGDAQLELAVFDNPGGGYWVSRANAAARSTSTFTYQAWHDDWYGLVLANVNGGSGSYEVGSSSCPPAPALAQDVPQSVPAVPAVPGQGRFEIDTRPLSWLAIGSRAEASGEDWDLTLYDQAAGSPAPLCLSGVLAASALPAGTADVVAGDVRLTNHPFYYPRVTPNGGASQPTTLEWDLGDEVLTVDGPGVSIATGPQDVVECWSLYLEQFQAVNLVFEPEGAAQTRLLVFRNPGGITVSGHWAPRAAAELSTTEARTYVAPEAGWYGIVVVNDNGASGSYRLRAVSTVTATGDGPVATETRFEGASPNPGVSGTRFHFTLGRPASVGFELLDVGGRIVARIPERDYAAGRSTSAWDGSGGEGGSLAAGVYFVRMRVDGRPQPGSRFVLLR